jgi:hypothetical protein
MMADDNSRVALAEPAGQKKKSSHAAKLAQAAALAALLVPLGSVAMEGASITCPFDYDGGSSGSCFGDFYNTGYYSGDSATFFFDPDFDSDVDYKYFLDFTGLSQDITVNITDVLLDPLLAFEPREGAPGDYDCLATFGGFCPEFVITTSAGNSGPWTSYFFRISWFEDTGDLDPAAVRVLQNPGVGNPNDDGTLNFIIDMCLAFPISESDSGCEYEELAIDPFIESGDTDFSSQIVALRVGVPDPGGSLILLGIGLSGVLYRRRGWTRIPGGPRTV